MENEESKQSLENKCLHKDCPKLFLVSVMTFLGSFLAFYVLMHQTMQTMFLHKKYDFIQQERNMFKDAEKDFEKIKKYSEKEFHQFKNRISAVQTTRYDDAYVIVINLKPFKNDENNIRFNVNGNVVTVAGSIVKNKYNRENSYYFTESFEIPEKIVMNEIEKEKVGDKYIITLPIEK